MGPNHFIFDASQNQYHSRRNYYAHCRQLSGWPTCLAHVFILYASTILCCSDPEEQSSCVLDHIETARSLDTPGSAIVMSSTQPPTAGEPSKPRSSPVPKANDEPPRQRILVLGWRKCVVVVSDSNAS